MNQILRIFGFFILLFGFAYLQAQSDQVNITYKGDVTCEQINALNLYQFNGVGMDRVAFLNKTTGEDFAYSFPKNNEQFYYVGTGASNAKPLILGQEEKVVLKGNCRTFRDATFETSDLNIAYGELRTQMSALNNETNMLLRSMRSTEGDAANTAKVKASLKALDDKKLDLLLTTAETQPYLGKIAALTTYLSYQNNGSKYDNELDYYANEFFQHVNWKDEAYQQNAWVFESVKSYTETISLFGFTDEKHKQQLDDLLSMIPSESHTYQLALAAIVSALSGKKHPNLVPFGEQFVKKYKVTAPSAAQSIERMIAGEKAFMVGAEAPDFTQETPEGEALSLSDLKGKVVLVDFWASWCGPCRRENPNVVKMYDRYKDEGFEILGVSLDKQKARWVQAIEKDKLTWKHVSDLKGWQNEVAQLYGVRSIPSTILLDAEGKVIAKNLRGPQLEAKLREVFAEK